MIKVFNDLEIYFVLLFRKGRNVMNYCNAVIMRHIIT